MSRGDGILRKQTPIDLARAYFLPVLGKIDLTTEQIDRQSLPGLKHSLQLIDEMIQNHQGYGTFRVKMTADIGLIVTQSTTEYSYEMGILPVLIEQKQQIIKRIQTLENTGAGEPTLLLEEKSTSSEEAAPMNIIRILHLSDIHLGTSAESQKYRVQLETDLLKNLKIASLDYLVISGDAANRSTPEEYTPATELVEGLMKCFNLAATRLVIVPGNHDLNLDLAEGAYNFVSKRKTTTGIDLARTIPAGEAGILVRDDAVYPKRFDYFNEYFYHHLIGQPYPADYVQQGGLQIFAEHQLLFLTLNSAWQIDHHYRSRSGINMQALSHALEQISDPQYDDWLKLAVWHHPVTGKEMMNDEFLQLLSVHGFQVCLHGHIHEATEGFYKYDDGRGINIIGAGTFGAPAREQATGIPLQYNLLKLDRSTGTLTVETRKKEKPDGAWSADARWGDKNNPKPRYSIQLKRWGKGQATSDILPTASPETPIQSSLAGKQSKMILPSQQHRGIPSSLLVEIRITLMECEEFADFSRLRALFVAERLRPFRAGLPQGHAIAEQVDLTIAYLSGKYLANGENALVILLEELRDRTDQILALHQNLGRLVKQLKEVV